MRKNRLTATAALSIMAAGSWLAGSAAICETIDASQSQGVSLTIYNQNFGLVKDIREVDLKPGVNYLRFEDVAAKIDPTSVSFQCISQPNAIVVREQNYQYDLLDPETILAKSIGKEVKFKQFLANGQIVEITGTLLNAPRSTVVDVNGQAASNQHGLVVKTADGLILNPAGQVQLAELPEGLISKPSLLWKLESGKGGKHKSEIGYQTSDMNWSCDYVAIVNEDDTQCALTGWVSLDNRCGASFKQAACKLIAGDVHRVQPPVARVAMHAYVDEATDGRPQFQEQSFAEYHMYTLKGKTDVNNNEIKQLSLFEAQDIPLRKKYVLETSQYPVPVYGDQPMRDAGNVSVKLEMDNSEENHLGMPLPKGKVRVYKRDKDGALQFIGEDQIDHTPKREKVRILIGNAFDVVAHRKQTNLAQVSNHLRKSSFDITVYNHKDQEITVTLVEHAFGDWKIESSSQPYTKQDSTTFEFSLTIPANSEGTVTYEIEHKV